jgi:hypothetical protein
MFVLKQIAHLDPVRDEVVRARAGLVGRYIAEYSRGHRTIEEVRTLVAPVTVETPESPFRSTASTVVTEVTVGGTYDSEVTRTRFLIVQGAQSALDTRPLAVCA